MKWDYNLLISGEVNDKHTLRIVAYLMNKISLDDLQLDLMMKLSHMIPKVYVGDEHISKYFIP